eukprot:TRINITY_DN2552_c0_g1_i1.p1 TRINITY_DN2552_c0_g1~~TRINITY_DN2552_c0_g1_i1.p1  ORF type:complete len:147 (-),score=22.41 TRINITY_DN2552_c0_g1_i1:45-485(-)
MNTNAVLFVKEDGDPMDVLKALVKFEKDNKLPAIKVGSFEGVTYDAEGVRELSKLPSRIELLGMLANVMQSPIVGVTRALNGIILKLAYALNAVKDKKAEQIVRSIKTKQMIKPRRCNLKCQEKICLLYTSPSPRDRQKSRMPSSA